MRRRRNVAEPNASAANTYSVYTIKGPRRVRHVTEVTAREFAACTLVRCDLYAEFIIDRYFRAAANAGRLQAPLGERRMAPITRADVSTATAAVARQSDCVRRSEDLSGPATLGGDDLAALAASLSNRPTPYAPVATADYLLDLWSNYAHPWPHAFSSLAQPTRQGRYDRIADGVDELLGRPPQALAGFLGQAWTAL